MTTSASVSPIATEAPLEASSEQKANPNGNNTIAYAAAGSAAAAAAAAAGVFFLKRGKAAKASIIPSFKGSSSANPLYEGIEEIENPLYDAHDFDVPVQDDFATHA